MGDYSRFGLGSPWQLGISTIAAVVVAIAIAVWIAQLWAFGFQMVIVVFAAFVLALGFWTIHRTNTRLTRVAEVVRAIEKGDYAARSTVFGS